MGEIVPYRKRKPRPDLAERNRRNGTHRRSSETSGAYKVWFGMKQRCYNKNNKDFGRYGGRGISVCERWKNSFEAFLGDMGEKPENKTLDRINSNGNYEPENCRWATSEEQGNNRRRELKMFRQTLRYRLENGWPEDAILSLIPKSGNKITMETKTVWK